MFFANIGFYHIYYKKRKNNEFFAFVHSQYDFMLEMQLDM